MESQQVCTPSVITLTSSKLTIFFYAFCLSQVFKQLQDDDLTELDKIYLILAENSLPDSFNVLCYDLGIKTFEDWRRLDDENLERFKLLPKFAKAQLKLLPFKAENTDFVNLALVSSFFSFFLSQSSIAKEIKFCKCWQPWKQIEKVNFNSENSTLLKVN